MNGSTSLLSRCSIGWEQASTGMAHPQCFTRTSVPPWQRNPTWSQLDDADRKALENDDGPLWHKLLEALCPQIVVLSVAKDRLKHIAFTPRNDWTTVHTFLQKADDTPRARPYEIRARWYDVSQQQSLFVFGSAAQTPFGLLADRQK